jgi:3-hydroxy acid dehydrogenase / malonic semialdehyde reductase
VSSIAGKNVFSGAGGYCATKHAVDALTRTLRIELVSTKINVVSIEPGSVMTDFAIVRNMGDQEVLIYDRN